MAGEITATLRRSLVLGNMTIGGESLPFSADYELHLQKLVPANTSAGEFVVTIDVDNLIAIGIVADQECTIKTNVFATPTDTIVLYEDQPLIWVDGDPTGTQFFTSDVTKIFVTTGASATTIKLAAAIDSSPVL